MRTTKNETYSRECSCGVTMISVKVVYMENFAIGDNENFKNTALSCFIMTKTDLVTFLKEVQQRAYPSYVLSSICSGSPLKYYLKSKYEIDCSYMSKVEVEEINSLNPCGHKEAIDALKAKSEKYM